MSNIHYNQRKTGNANVTIRMDAQLKKQAEALFADMGMNMTTAFTLFAKAAVRQGRIPFEITGDPFYCEANRARLLKAAEEMEHGLAASHELAEDE